MANDGPFAAVTSERDWNSGNVTLAHSPHPARMALIDALLARYRATGDRHALVNADAMVTVLEDAAGATVSPPTGVSDDEEWKYCAVCLGGDGPRCAMCRAAADAGATSEDAREGG